MNYLLFVVILGLCAGAYYTHTQDQQQIASLQAELAQAQASPAAAVATTDSTPHPTSTTPEAPATPGMTHDLDSPPPALSNNPAHPAAPVHPVTVAVIPDDTHSTAIDSAAQAAQAAANSTDIGTVTTLDNHSYTNCKVVKVEQDGVTFSDDTGITKIEYPMMPPALQKKFGYAAPSSP